MGEKDGWKEGENGEVGFGGTFMELKVTTSSHVLICNKKNGSGSVPYSLVAHFSFSGHLGSFFG